MSEPAQPVDPLIGALLHGKYRLVRRIGSGGFGTVYEASDERGAGNRVAVKVLNKEFSADANLVRAFRAEARRVTRLSHPNIVDWKNFDVDESGVCYFVMELVEGEELDRLLERDRPLAPARAAHILLQILDALRTAHHLAEGGSVLHLDLKPRNVFVLPARPGRLEQVKVIDFGIGQHIGEEAEDEPVLPGASGRPGTSWVADFNPSTLHFQESKVVDPPGLRRCQGCTPEYASPEQAAHVLGLPDVVPLDGRSDIYSLGVMAYQMLTGDLPFARPVVRTDYLRLHLSGKPRKLATARTKVPRDLARFVERCLQKDREARFADAREAYAAMERIVRPSLALRVGVAAVVLVGAAFAFGRYVFGGETRVVVLTAAGVELDAQHPLYLGPEQHSAVLEVSAPGVVESGSPLTLVRVDDAKEVPGSHVTLTSDSELRLELDEGLADGRKALPVRVKGKGVSFKPFELVWLGKSAWTLERARAGGIDLTGAQRAIDPQGLSLEVALAGEGRDAVERVTARRDGGDEVELVASGVKGDQRLLRADFGLLQVHPGRERIVVRAKDRAGGAHTLDVPLVIVDGVLTADADLCARSADGSLARFNQMNGRFLLAPSSKTLLHVAPSRSAKLDWRLRLEGATDEPPWNHEQAAASHTIPIELPPASGSERRNGTVELLVDEGDLVVRAESARARLSQKILFEVSSELADFNASLELSDPAQGGSGTGRRVPLKEEGTTWVGPGKLQLVVERRGRPAMSLRLDNAEIGILGVAQEELLSPLDIPGEGTRELELRGYRFDTTEHSSADQPDKQRTFTIGVDTHPPVLDLLAGLEGKVFRSLEELPESVTPVLEDGNVGSPVRVDWQLGVQPDAPFRTGTWQPGKQPIPLRELWSAQGRYPDGAWTLELTAVDEAMNKALPLPVRFNVAINGPDVHIDSPQQGMWQRDGDRWHVQLTAKDPNGVDVAHTTCAIAAEGANPLPVVLKAGTGPPQSLQLHGYVVIPYDWSSRRVQIVGIACDKLGKERSFSLDGLDLPIIRPPEPATIRATDESRKDRARMRLVRGNEAQYLFGGRGDDVENQAHREAGLPAFAMSDSARSWRVPCANGEIGSFYLDEREVSRADYLVFLRDPQGYAHAPHWPAGSSAPTEARRKELEAQLAGDSDLPVTDVTWEEAWAFADWVGRRLPSWVEFEYAVRGGPGPYRPFAGFQDAPPASGEINSKSLGVGHAWACGSQTDITHDTRISDLAGNVAEWTGTPLALPGDPEPEDRAAYFREHRQRLLAVSGLEQCPKYWVAGGSFRQEYFYFEAAAAQSRCYTAHHVGFRCALSIKAVQDGLDNRRLEELKEPLK